MRGVLACCCIVILPFIKKALSGQIETRNCLGGQPGRLTTRRLQRIKQSKSCQGKYSGGLAVKMQMSSLTVS
jgi:hypothetical protein